VLLAEVEVGLVDELNSYHRRVPRVWEFVTQLVFDFTSPFVYVEPDLAIAGREDGPDPQGRPMQFLEPHKVSLERILPRTGLAYAGN
jgi:hypothetical protein